MNYCKLYDEELQMAADSLDLSDLYGKSILITGCNGLICSAIVDMLIYANRFLHADITIYLAALTEEETQERFAPFYHESYLHYVHYNALEPVAFPFPVDYIIHGASNAHPAAYLKEPVETLLANVTGIKELLDYAKNVQAKRVLYISSSEVYGQKNAPDEPYQESDYGFVDLLNPRACYPSGKRASETLCSAYYAEYGIETLIVRPGHIYGPTVTSFDTRATAQFTRDILEGRNIIMKSAGTQLRSYCYGTDCASAILTVLLHGKPAEAYNISNRNSVVSIRQIAEAFAEYAGCQVVFENASDAEQKSYNLMDNSSLHAEKLEALGWKALFSLEEGARRTIELMRKNS